jgi:hypothetical protein
MNPLPELFLAPCVGPGYRADIAMPLTHQFAGAAVYYNGRPERVEFVQAELAGAGVPEAAARAFLSSSEPVGARLGVLGVLSDIGRALKNAWDPDRHPRGGHGYWTSAGESAGGLSTGGSVAEADLDHSGKAILAKVDDSLKKSGVSGLRGQEYRAAVFTILRATPAGCLARLNANLRSIHFVADFAQVSPVLRRRVERLGYNPGDVPDGACGGYLKDDKAVVADGGVPGTRPEEGVHTVGVYAHELGHAIDGPDDEISNSKAWQAAWAKEMKNAGRPPSEYAQVSASEGFAEYHRLLVANRKQAVALYPRCADVWRGRGLL